MADSEPNPDPETAGITGQRRTLPGDTKAAVPLPPGRFKPWEEWAWDMISSGLRAVMSAVPVHARGDQDVDKPPVTDPVRRTDHKLDLDKSGKAIILPEGDWPIWQRLSPEFMQLILLNPVWRDSKMRQRVFVAHARFDKDLLLDGEDIPGDLGFYNCAFAGELNLLGSRISGLLNLHGSVFDKQFTADSLETGGALFLRNGAVFRNKVRLVGARVGGSLGCNGSQFEDSFEADSLICGGGAFLSDGSVFQGEARLLSAKVRGNLYCSGSRFESGFSADGIEVGRGVALHGQSHFRGDIRLLSAKIGADLSCDKSTFEGTFHGDGLEAKGSAFMRNGATFKGDIEMPGAMIGRDLHLWGAEFDAALNLSGMRIIGELMLDETKGDLDCPKWHSTSYLNLQNARLGALQSSIAAWKMASGKFVPRDLDGLTFERAGGGVGGACLEDAKVEDLICWLEDDTEPNGGKVKRSDYSPSPYRALAQALDASGHRSKARRVRWALARREKRALSWFNPLKYLSALSGLVIGYGYFQARGLIVFLGLVAAYAAIGHLWTADWKPTVPTVASAIELAEWLRFSLSNAVPVVELDPVKEDFLLAKFGEPIPEPVRWVFWSQRLLALILLSLIIAGLTGWAQRRGE